MSTAYRDEETGLMLLEPIEYISSSGGGFAVPDEERARFDKAPYSASRAPRARPLRDIIATIGRLGYVDQRAEEAFEAAYEMNAAAVSFMAHDVESLFSHGKCSNPVGLMLKKMKGIHP